VIAVGDDGVLCRSASTGMQCARACCCLLLSSSPSHVSDLTLRTPGIAGGTVGAVTPALAMATLPQRGNAANNNFAQQQQQQQQRDRELAAQQLLQQQQQQQQQREQQVCIV
jgi:hypothetical protein